MSFALPLYHHPDFSADLFVNAPDITCREAETDGVAPEYYHSTSMYPEYFKINGEWNTSSLNQRAFTVTIA